MAHQTNNLKKKISSHRSISVYLVQFALSISSNNIKFVKKIKIKHLHSTLFLQNQVPYKKFIK